MRIILILALTPLLASCAAGSLAEGFIPATVADVKALKADIDNATTADEVAMAIDGAANSITERTADLVSAAVPASPITGNPLIDIAIGLGGLFLTGAGAHKATMKARDNNRRLRHEPTTTDRTT